MGDSTVYSVTLEKRKRLPENTLEIHLTKPLSLEIIPGQRVRLYHPDMERDYTPVSIQTDPQIILYVRKVQGGRFTSVLDEAPVGISFPMTGPHGYFVFRPAAGKPVFVATGTGIAPFVAMARSGIKGFMLLHGVRSPEELYYRSLFESVAEKYVPCISRPPDHGPDEYPGIQGRVTDYLQRHLSPGDYEFYLCGRGDMIRDVIHIVDKRFPHSLVHTEVYYG